MANPFAIAAGGLSLIQGISGASQERKMAELTAQSIQEEMRLLSEQREKLGEFYTQRRGLITDVYGNRVSNLMDAVGQTLQEQGIEADYRLGKTGLAYSGSVRTRDVLSRKKTVTDYSRRQGSLYDKMKSDILDTQMAESRDISSLDIRQANLEGQLDIAREQMDTKFLGIF